MFIRASNIYLRALESIDLELLYVLENNMNVWKVSNTITPFSKDLLELYLHSAHQDIYTNKQLRLMICLNSKTPQFGTIDLFDFDPMNLRVGVGVFIFEEYRKMGYAKEAIELIKEYTRHTLLLNQIFCNISISNTESKHLFESCGFEKIGIKKIGIKFQKRFEDELMYQIIL